MVQVADIFSTACLAPLGMVPPFARVRRLTVALIFGLPKLRCIVRRYDSVYRENWKSLGPHW